MSQRDIYIYLKNNKGVKFTLKELKNNLKNDINPQNIAIGLKKLRNSNFINFEIIKHCGVNRGVFKYWV